MRSTVKAAYLAACAAYRDGSIDTEELAEARDAYLAAERDTVQKEKK